MPSDWNRIGILRNDPPIEEQQTGNPLDSIALARPASTKESGLEILRSTSRYNAFAVQAFFQRCGRGPLPVLLRNCRLSQPSLPSPEKRFTRLPFNDFENENKRPPFNRGRGGASKSNFSRFQLEKEREFTVPLHFEITVTVVGKNSRSSMI